MSCEYCGIRSDSNIYDDFTGTCVYVSGTRLCIDADAVALGRRETFTDGAEINFCPMCGRRLGGGE